MGGFTGPCRAEVDPTKQKEAAGAQQRAATNRPINIIGPCCIHRTMEAQAQNRRAEFRLLVASDYLLPPKK
jgi:hypothetical protein